MPSRLAERITEFLRHDQAGDASVLQSFPSREWKRALPWLDASGLALYFLNRIEKLDGGGMLPAVVLTRLRQNRKDNRARTSAFLDEMRVIHQSFEANGVEFALLKGYSLVPEYCPAPELRHQCDLDYLIAEDNLHRASSILHAMGYSRVRKAPGTHTFSRSTGDLPSRDNIYKAGLNYSVEVHAALWENEDVPGLERLPGVLGRRQTHQLSGLVFPTLAAEDRFIHQCTHVLSHVLQFWIRLAWLYEIATFLNQARTDVGFWRRVGSRIGGRVYIAKAVQLVTLLATTVFAGEAPPIQGSDYPALRLWVNDYGRQWAMHDLPGSKLSLFLFPEFVDEEQWRRLRRQRLFPLRRSHSATQLSASEPRLSLGAQFAEFRYAGQRLAFHMRETWRYLREQPRWQQSLRAWQEKAPYERLETVMR